MAHSDHSADQLVLSEDHNHPANLICDLCRKFYTLGWVCPLLSPQFRHDRAQG